MRQIPSIPLRDIAATNLHTSTRHSGGGWNLASVGCAKRFNLHTIKPSKRWANCVYATLQFTKRFIIAHLN